VTLPIRITAPTLEELQHEGREALLLWAAELSRSVLSPLHEPLLPPVKTGVEWTAALAGSAFR
jgi:hypothetical protein